MTRISDLLDLYDGPVPEIAPKAAAPAERIAARTMEKLHDGARPGPHKAPRRISRTALIAAAAAAVLIVSALAAGGLLFSEIPAGVRAWLGIKAGPVPGCVIYNTVNIAKNARTADVDHDGDGELYASSGVTVRTENFVMVYVSVSTVTREQYENYVWRAQIDGTDDWVVAEADFESDFYADGESSYHEDEYGIRAGLGGWLDLRVTFPLDPAITDTLHVTLYGGTESADKKTFNVERIGIFTIDPGAPSPTYTVTFGDGIPITNTATSETGLLLRADISADRMIWYYRADGLYDLYNVTYGDERDTLPDSEWPALNKKLMGWANGLFSATGDSTLDFSDGTTLGPLMTGAGNYLEDDTGMAVTDFRDPIDMGALESITVAGQTYAIGRDAG